MTPNERPMLEKVDGRNDIYWLEADFRYGSFATDTPDPACRLMSAWRRGAYDSSDVPLAGSYESEASHSFWADRSSQGWQSGLPACIAENFVFVHVICPWLLEAASPTATSIFSAESHARKVSLWGKPPGDLQRVRLVRL
jgi:hypothetical protein